MAETLKTSFRPWRYILIVAVLFVLAGFVTGATNILGLIGLLAALLAVVAIIWFIANVGERRKRIRTIDGRLKAARAELTAPSGNTRAYDRALVTQLLREIADLEEERATLIGWFAQ